MDTTATCASDSNLLFAESSERDDEPEFYRALWPPSQSESQTSNQIHRALVIEEKSGLASRLGDKIRSNFNRPKLRWVLISDVIDICKGANRV